MEFISQEIDVCLTRPGEEKILLTELLKQSEGKFDKTELYFIVKEFLGGGPDTGSTIMLWALILLTNNPDIQKRLQKEMYSVVPRERLLSLSDKVQYLEATILEVMRLKTVLPLSLPHTITCDTEVAGYFITRDTQVDNFFANI